MATSGQQGKANWNDSETAAFIEYLWENRSEGGDGGTFKDVTMRAQPLQWNGLYHMGQPMSAKGVIVPVPHGLANQPIQWHKRMNCGIATVHYYGIPVLSL